MIDISDIKALDAADPLRNFRQEFELPDDLVYLDGNSLGALSRLAQQRVADAIANQWGQDLVKSWNMHHWIDLPQSVGEKIAALIGAGIGQVTCCDSISVNLFKLITAGLGLQSGRRVILSTSDNFPTDIYIAQGIEKLLSSDRCELKLVEESEIINQIDSSVALLLVSHVNFRTGEILDMRKITASAHKQGVLVIWDLAHSAGALPLELDSCQVDFAVGCGYKYLNGGPGAPAFLYVANRHQEQIRQPISGWMGHSDPFAFSTRYTAAPGIHQFLSGTPSILSLVSLDAALDVFANTSMAQLRKKSLQLSGLYMDLLRQYSLLDEFTLLASEEDDRRGSQVAITHPQAYAICQVLIDRAVVMDFREPDTLRAGFAPMYNSYNDIWRAVNELQIIMKNEEHLDPRWQARNKVT